jgi:hypothetical protein
MLKAPSTHILLEGVLRKIFPPSYWANPIKIMSPQEKAIALDAILNGTHEMTGCECVHPNSCLVQTTAKCISVIMRTSTLYTLIHLVPFLAFRRGKDKYSLKSLLKLVTGILKSIMFASHFSFVGKGCWCLLTKLKQPSSWHGLLMGFVSSIAIFWESPSRWPEFAMNMLPRWFETIAPTLRKQKRWIEIPYGQNLLLAVTMAIIGWIYFEEPTAIKKQIKWLLDLVLGHFPVNRIPASGTKEIVKAELAKIPSNIVS